MADTAIEWCSKVWNPTTGCDRVSAGCDHCYALTMAKRLKGMGSAKYQNDGNPKTSGPGFGIAMHPDALGTPLAWRKPERIFVNSMSDLFHDGVSDGFIAQVWEVMARCPQHTFMILTKRHARMRSWVTRWHDNAGDDDVSDSNGLSPMPRGPEAVREVYSSPRAMLFADMLESMGTPPEGCAYPLYDWMEGPRWFPGVLPNVWLGTSAENQQWAKIRGNALRETPAAVRFFSCEPLLGPMDDLDLTGILWVITGGESGHGARPAHPDWFRSIRDQCVDAGVAYLHKQNGEWIEDVTHYPADPEIGIDEPYRVLNIPPDHKSRNRCVMHRAGMTALTPDNPFNPFRAGHPGWTAMRRVGKKAAGRELDGATWDQYPEAVTR